MDAKGIIQKINIFSDFSSLILPVVIGLGAVLIFIPAQLMGSKFKKQVTQESVNGLGGEVQSLLKKPVSGDQHKVERDYQSTHKADKERIADFAAQSTQRELLSYSIFPKPKDTSKLVFQEFGRRYCDGIENLLAGVNAGDCPTEEELNKNIESSRASRKRRGRPGTSERGNVDLMSRLFGERTRGPARGRYGHLNEVDSTIRDVLCEQKAKSASVVPIMQRRKTYSTVSTPPPSSCRQKYQPTEKTPNLVSTLLLTSGMPAKPCCICLLPSIVLS